MDIVGLIYIVLGLAVAGFVIWLILTYIPMNAIVKQIIIVVIVILLILWFLHNYGSLFNFNSAHLRR